MSEQLLGRNIWITGASSGVGEGMERVREECDEGLGGITLIPFDIAEQAEREAAAAEVLAEFPRIDVLVNNAGIGQRSLAKDTFSDVDRRIMEVDFFGPVALSKLVLPRMLEQGHGHMVVTSSVACKACLAAQ